MKPLKLILSTLIVIALLNSCEKKENNPFIGSWENTETTGTDYTYSYTDSQITVQEVGKPEETTDYMISGNSLVLSIGGMGLTTFTKI